MDQTPDHPKLTSLVCRREHFDTGWYKRWATAFTGDAHQGADLASGPDRPQFHRKNWEWAAVTEALAERDMLLPGRRGMGFAVGREPLASLFAAHGAEVLATDLAADDDQTSAWSDSGQHAASLDALHWPHLLDRSTFDSRVTFMPQDMRNLRTQGLGSFDFLWSACSFEHLGDLEAGLQFVLRSTELLKPGGIAVHTTEFNLSSLDQTLEDGNSVIYRRCDLASLEHRLRGIACAMEPLDAFGGTAMEDIEFDYAPFYQNGRQHVKLMLGGFVTTSVLLIIRKGRYPGGMPPLDASIGPTVAARGPDLLASCSEEARLTAELVRLQAEVATLYTSSSWRLTSPLRALARLARRRG